MSDASQELYRRCNLGSQCALRSGLRSKNVKALRQTKVEIVLSEQQPDTNQLKKKIMFAKGRRRNLYLQNEKCYKEESGESLLFNFKELFSHSSPPRASAQILLISVMRLGAGHGIMYSSP